MTMPSEDEGATATGNTHKILGKDWSRGSRDMLADRHVHRDRQTNHNTPLPYRGGVSRENRPTFQHPQLDSVYQGASAHRSLC